MNTTLLRNQNRLFSVIISFSVSYFINSTTTKYYIIQHRHIPIGPKLTKSIYLEFLLY